MPNKPNGSKNPVTPRWPECGVLPKGLSSSLFPRLLHVAREVLWKHRSSLCQDMRLEKSLCSHVRQ